MKYYKKELLSNRLALPNGRGVQFEQIGQSDTGVIATEDPWLIGELDKAAQAGRGGVIEINEQIYEELKKNPPVTPSRLKSLSAQSIRQLLASQNRVGSAAADVAVNHQPSAPMEVPDGKGLVTVSSRRKLRELAESPTPPAPSSSPTPAPAPKAPAPKPAPAKAAPTPPAPANLVTK